MPFPRRIRTLVLMAPAERRITIEALLLPCLVSLGFRFFGVPRTQAWTRRWATAGRDQFPAGGPDAIIRFARRAQGRVSRAGGVLGPCLVRSLTLWAMLLRRGVSTNLRVGFRKRDGKIEGHAWVEHDQIPINEDRAEIETYAIYDRPVQFDMWLKPKDRAPIS